MSGIVTNARFVREWRVHPPFGASLCDRRRNNTPITGNPSDSNELMCAADTLSTFQIESRAPMQALGIFTLMQARTMPADRRMRTARMIYIRQQPQTVKSVTFLGMQNETALMD